MADTDKNAELIQNFIDVTGCNKERAEFYLQASSYNLETALSSFYDGDNDDVVESMQEDREVQPQVEVKPSAEKPISSTDKKSKSKFATLRNLDSSSEEEDDKGQAFYAGGSEHSGQQIIGPPRKNPIKDMVSDIFRTAQSGNMESFDPSDAPAGTSRRSFFSGVGYRLGETENDTVAVDNRPENRSRTSSECDTVTVKVYRQGFSVDDGDLRPYDDPKNKEFFECILRNEIPAELRKQGTRMVHLNVEDHMHEEYVKRAPKFKAFTGSGHTLGSPAPATTPTASPEQTTATSGDTPLADCEARAVAHLNVDQSQPTTMIQIRLADGSRLSSRFNVTHTVQDIRTYISMARPQYGANNFILLTTFPNKELSDDTETIEKAGLKNAAILQRLK
jgi:UBX domain-containing protein 1